MFVSNKQENKKTWELKHLHSTAHWGWTTWMCVSFYRAAHNFRSRSSKGDHFEISQCFNTTNVFEKILVTKNYWNWWRGFFFLKFSFYLVKVKLLERSELHKIAVDKSLVILLEMIAVSRLEIMFSKPTDYHHFHSLISHSDWIFEKLFINSFFSGKIFHGLNKISFQSLLMDASHTLKIEFLTLYLIKIWAYCAR